MPQLKKELMQLMRNYGQLSDVSPPHPQVAHQDSVLWGNVQAARAPTATPTPTAWSLPRWLTLPVGGLVPVAAMLAGV